MKILEIGTRETAHTITLFAKCKIRHVGYDEAYFTFDKKYKPFIKVDASPFAAALLIPSMKQGQDLIIEGKISKELYDGMQQVVKIVSSWDIGLSPIKIVADKLTPDTAKPTVTASLFSGGVDSFYTYLKHKYDRDDPVTHLMLVQGFDIDPRNTALWDATLSNIKEIADAERANLIVAKSNLRELIDPILPWDYAHGGCLAAVGLCLRKGIKQIYIPSSCTAEQQFPWGSHLEVDHHWGTEKLAFVHDGTEASRFNKMEWQVAKSPSACKYLRVCYMNETGAYNCGVCPKCVRTMTSLYIMGALDKVETFPHEIDVQQIADMPVGRHCEIFHEENIAALDERHIYPELREALRASLARATDSPMPLSKRAITSAIYLDHVYMRGNLYKLALGTFGRKF